MYTHSHEMGTAAVDSHEVIGRKTVELIHFCNVCAQSPCFLLCISRYKSVLEEPMRTLSGRSSGLWHCMWKDVVQIDVVSIWLLFKSSMPVLQTERGWATDWFLLGKGNGFLSGPFLQRGWQWCFEGFHCMLHETAEHDKLQNCTVVEELLVDVLQLHNKRMEE